MCKHHVPHKQSFYEQFMLNVHAFHKTMKAMKFSSLKLFTYSYIQYCSYLSTLSNYFVHKTPYKRPLLLNLSIETTVSSILLQLSICNSMQAMFCWDKPTILSLKVCTKGTQLIICTTTKRRPRYSCSTFFIGKPYNSITYCRGYQCKKLFCHI